VYTVTDYRGETASEPVQARGAPVRIELAPHEIDDLDVLPRQIARLVDPHSGSEWVVDARRCGTHLQVRAVEYASDGLWMPHVWREVPDGAQVYFIEGRGIEVRTATTGRLD